MNEAPVQSVDAVLNQPELGAYRRMLYAAGALLMALEGYDAYIVSNLAPFIVRSFDAPIANMALVFSLQSAGMAVGFYAIPPIADRKGRRGVILIGAALFALLTLLSTVPITLEGFAIVRFLTFVAFGGTMPNIVALVAEYLPDKSRGRLLTWLFIAQGLGASAAGLIGPSFVEYHSWQLAFWFGGGVLLLAIPLLYIYLPESSRFLMLRDPEDKRIGALLKRVDPAFEPQPGARYVTAEEKVSGSSVTALFRDGRATLTVLLWLSMAMTLCVVQSMTAWLPSFLHVLGGIPEAEAARMMAFSAFGAIIGPLMLTLLMRWMRQATALAIMLCTAFVVMTATSAVEQYALLGWACGFAFGLLVIGSIAGLNALVAASYPTAMRSTGIGWAGGIGRITAIAGPGLAGAMLAAQWTPLAIYSAMSAPLLVAGIAMALLARHRSQASAKS
jgi:AAHS family 4-hydroxybenzoate transporter-like MFS transporter